MGIKTRYLFYKATNTKLKKLRERPDIKYDFGYWKPGLLSIMPFGITNLTFFVWWLFHYLRVFSNRGYRIFIIRNNNKVIIHRSCIFPRYFRFPFMNKDDLQIGDTWTKPEYRGQGLATSAIRTIIQDYMEPNRDFWYVVSEENKPSIRVIEKAGFDLVGTGDRTKRFGMSIFGSYKLNS